VRGSGDPVRFIPSFETGRPWLALTVRQAKAGKWRIALIFWFFELVLSDSLRIKEKELEG
jgi:hypothetical protein